jgi:hypothetical protein
LPHVTRNNRGSHCGYPMFVMAITVWRITSRARDTHDNVAKILTFSLPAAVTSSFRLKLQDFTLGIEHRVCVCVCAEQRQKRMKWNASASYQVNGIVKFTKLEIHMHVSALYSAYMYLSVHQRALRSSSALNILVFICLNFIVTRREDEESW